MSILTKLHAKPIVTTVTLSFQVTPELHDRLVACAARADVPKYNLLKVIMDQGIDDVNKALDEEEATTPTSAPATPDVDLPDLTPTPQYDEAGIATEY